MEAELKFTVCFFISLKETRMAKRQSLINLLHRHFQIYKLQELKSVLVIHDLILMIDAFHMYRIKIFCNELFA